MSTETRSLLRGLAALGATVAVIATFVSWYSFEVAVQPTGRVVTIFEVPITLWGFTTLAPILIVAGAVASLTVLALVDSRIAGAVTALIGVAIAAYAVVRCFDIPNLGIRDLGQAAGQVRADTQLDGGPFLALTGGILLALGSLADLLPAREEPEGTAMPAGRSVLRPRRAASPRMRRAAR